MKRRRLNDENTVVRSLYLWKTAAIYAAVYCHDDFYFYLWCGGWLFYLKLCGENALCRGEFYYAFSDDSGSPGVYVWYGRQRFGGHDGGRRRPEEGEPDLFSSDLCLPGLRCVYCHSGGSVCQACGGPSGGGGNAAGKLCALRADYPGSNTGVHAADGVPELFCGGGKASAGADGDSGLRRHQHGAGRAVRGRVPLGNSRSGCGYGGEPGGGRSDTADLFFPAQPQSFTAHKDKI